MQITPRRQLKSAFMKLIRKRKLFAFEIIKFRASCVQASLKNLFDLISFSRSKKVVGKLGASVCVCCFISLSDFNYLREFLSRLMQPV